MPNPFQSGNNVSRTPVFRVPANSTTSDDIGSVIDSLTSVIDSAYSYATAEGKDAILVYVSTIIVPLTSRFLLL